MRKSPKQIAAIICICILVLLYVLLFVFAVLDIPSWEKWFRTCLYATITIPLLTWIYIFLYGKMKNKHTIASADIFMTPEEAKKQQEAKDAEDL